MLHKGHVRSLAVSDTYRATECVGRGEQGPMDVCKKMAVAKTPRRGYGLTLSHRQLQSSDIEDILLRPCEDKSYL
jgi:hypothetical protein